MVNVLNLSFKLKYSLCVLRCRLLSLLGEILEKLMLS